MTLGTSSLPGSSEIAAEDSSAVMRTPVVTAETTLPASFTLGRVLFDTDRSRSGGWSIVASFEGVTSLAVAADVSDVSIVRELRSIGQTTVRPRVDARDGLRVTGDASALLASFLIGARRCVTSEALRMGRDEPAELLRCWLMTRRAVQTISIGVLIPDVRRVLFRIEVDVEVGTDREITLRRPSR